MRLPLSAGESHLLGAIIMKHFFSLLLLFIYTSPTLAFNAIEKGILTFEHGDSHDERGIHVVRYYLETDSHKIPLNVSKALQQNPALKQWTGEKVRVQMIKQSELTTKGAPESTLSEPEMKVQSIELMSSAQASGNDLTGAQPWISVLCKFSDKPNEPHDQTFYQQMYDNTEGRLDHFWREVSYGQMNVAGSKAIDWVTLPSPQSAYVPNPGNNADANLNLLYDDCIAAVDALVDFSDAGNGAEYAGINLMFNDTLDCCAWGGNRVDTLDGVNKMWRVTWEPIWSHTRIATIKHEMGHGMGLSHANNSDGDNEPQDNPWALMSSTGAFALTDPTYGKLGKHLNMAYKQQLGWVTDSDGFITNTSTDTIVSLDHTAIQTTNNHRFAKIPLSNGSYYMIEARKQTGVYAGALPTDAILIYHIIENREEPAWLIDKESPPADFSDNEGVMWKVGETFVDPIDGYAVSIQSQTVEGFTLRIEANPNLNGLCGNSHNTPFLNIPSGELCEIGVPANRAGGGPWTWSCLGTGTGTNVSCNAPAIPDDNYEQNDTAPDNAYNLSDHEGIFLETIDGLGIQRDNDWFKIHVDPGTSNLTISLEFTHTDGDIDLALVNSNGQIVQKSETESDNEAINYASPPSGDYFIRVFFGNQGNTYNLIWDDVGGSSISGDADGNGVINISDVIHTINLILSGATSATADCDGNSTLDIADVICSINIVLSQ